MESNKETETDAVNGVENSGTQSDSGFGASLDDSITNSIHGQGDEFACRLYANEHVNKNEPKNPQAADGVKTNTESKHVSEDKEQPGISSLSKMTGFMNGSLNLANHHDDSGHNGIGLLDPIGSSSLKNPFTTSGTVETVEGVKEVSKSNPRRVGFKRDEADRREKVQYKKNKAAAEEAAASRTPQTLNSWIRENLKGYFSDGYHVRWEDVETLREKQRTTGRTIYVIQEPSGAIREYRSSTCQI